MALKTSATDTMDLIKSPGKKPFPILYFCFAKNNSNFEDEKS
jgi:hypothetical protein